MFSSIAIWQFRNSVAEFQVLLFNMYNPVQYPGEKYESNYSPSSYG